MVESTTLIAALLDDSGFQPLEAENLEQAGLSEALVESLICKHLHVLGKATGRAAIAELARSLRERAEQPRPRAIHVVTNIAIALDGPRADVRSNWTTVQNSPEGPKIGSGGGYHDELVKESGSWLFRYRKIDRFIAP